MTNQPIRTCPFCAEQIMAEAKLCPRCRQWLSTRSLRHPIVSMFVMGVPVLGAMVVFGAVLFGKLDRFQNPKPYYSEFVGSIQVIESRMNWATPRDELRIFITGILTNQSPVAWKDVEFDCRFFDRNGVLLDASTGYGRFTILGNDDTAFRVSVVPAAATKAPACIRRTSRKRCRLRR